MKGSSQGLRGMLTTDYAVRGAQARLAEIERERQHIFKLFPQLRYGPGPTPTRRVSAAARKAMSEGMRKFWARRKAAKK